MKRLIFSLLLLPLAICVEAQKVSRSYKNTSLSDVLVSLNKASKRYSINFIYNELEDFVVTANVQNKTIPEAVREVVGFYPMQITQLDSIISVECVQKDRTKLLGRVVDEQGLPVEFANVSLLSIADSSFVNGGVSNADGRFVIPCAVHDVLLRVTFVGYKTVLRQVREFGDIGVIRMHPETQSIGAVVVRGVRPVHKLGREGMMTLVQGTSLATAGTASDVLGLLPNVDGRNGAFTVFGKQGAPLIYINGRQVRNSNELTQIKSDEIKQVEVITNPGARYSAEVNSVIKITTIRKAGDGLSGKVEAQYRQARRENYWEDTQLNYRKGGLDLNADVYLSKMTQVQEQETQAVVYNKVEENASLNDFVFDNPNDVYASFSANYDFGKDNFAGVRYSFQGSEGNGVLDMDCEDVFTDGTGSMLNYNSKVRMPFGGTHSVNAYYTGHVGKLGIDFNADYMRRKDRTMQLMQVTENGAKAETVSSDTRNRSRMLASKLLLTLPLWKGELSAGYEHSDTRRTGMFDGTGGVESHTDDLIDENTFAAFTGYDVQLGSWIATAGLRYEHTVSDYYDHGTWVAGQSRRYSNLFPNVGIGYSGSQFQLRLGYSMRTTRPSYNNLSSYTQFDTRYIYEGGNPLLRPSKRHVIEAQAIYKFVSLYASYTMHIDDIINFDKPYGDDAYAHSFMNMHDNQNLSVMLSASRKFFDFWEPNWSVGVEKQFFDASQLGVEGVSMERPRWRLKLNNSFHLPWGVSLGVNWNYWGRGYADNNLIYSRSQLDFSLYKGFLNNQLSVFVKANDVLKTSWDKSRWQGQYLHFLRDNYSDSRYVSLTVRYTFNATRSKYKGTGAGNDEKSRL